jgi:hypothetical protein
LGRAGGRDEHVIVVEERLAAFNHVLRAFKILGSNVVVAVLVWLPFSDA